MLEPGAAHPVLTIDEARQFEAALFGGDETREWPAMQRAGRAIADAVLRDYRELGAFPENARVLVLAGKGHNGGDALIAARHILEKHPRAKAAVCFVFGEQSLRPLAWRAHRELAQAAPERVAVFDAAAVQKDGAGFDLCLDGIFGFQFRPSVDERVAQLIDSVNALPVCLRAAVDMPSGSFRADFTYATGIVKTPVLENPNSGRVRYLDLGFFSGSPCRDTATLTPAALAPLRALRSSHTDKRDYGHLFIVGGSRKYPGAVLMSVQAALRSGAGLVTAFVPESLAPVFAAQVPEAIWHGMAESPGGGLALEDLPVFRERVSEKTSGTANATALVIGPGLSRDRESFALVTEILRINENIPVVLDADALQSDIIASGKAPRILTPHAGEYQRVEAAIPDGAVVVRKGPLTLIEHSGRKYISPFGGPVLARGGSGDLLAGMIGGLLAQAPGALLHAACRGTVWHGMAADCLARAHGQHAVRTTQLLDFLPEVLRGVSQ
ncbi:NAD(P)H-hydrate dehydratase [Ereboglobus luteus]|uniref:ADP-dependent (S)-NAD(P)H-hydrate dehydratase n=2 Tax=Ereboglobus luteus TaxID=1796921 RepID=A0A2U8E6I6_9BACT|nr:NAD(P)H-hydrate dehydratase [Ereboglobus luteus]